MVNELEHDWQSQRRRIRGTLTLSGNKPKVEDTANDDCPPEKPAA